MLNFHWFCMLQLMATQSLDPIIVRPQFNPKTIAFSIIYQIELVFWFKYQKMHFCHQDIAVQFNYLVLCQN